MPDYVFASFPLLASYSLCLAVGLGHSQSLASHMVLGGQCQSLSNSQTFVMAAQREAFLSTLSSIANIWHNSLAQHFFVINQSINFTLLRFEAHMVYSALLWKNQQHSDKLAKRLGYCIRMCAANILLLLCQIIWFLLFSDENFIENDSLLSILWDGSLDRGLASTLIMIHGVCKRFWLNILQS